VNDDGVPTSVVNLKSRKLLGTNAILNVTVDPTVEGSDRHNFVRAHNTHTTQHTAVLNGHFAFAQAYSSDT
jgi:hypothetical protein